MSIDNACHPDSLIDCGQCKNKHEGKDRCMRTCTSTSSQCRRLGKYMYPLDSEKIFCLQHLKIVKRASKISEIFGKDVGSLVSKYDEGSIFDDEETCRKCLFEENSMCPHKQKCFSMVGQLVKTSLNYLMVSLQKETKNTQKILHLSVFLSVSSGLGLTEHIELEYASQGTLLESAEAGAGKSVSDFSKFNYIVAKTTQSSISNTLGLTNWSSLSYQDLFQGIQTFVNTYYVNTPNNNTSKLLNIRIQAVMSSPNWPIKYGENFNFVSKGLDTWKGHSNRAEHGRSITLSLSLSKLN